LARSKLRSEFGSQPALVRLDNCPAAHCGESETMTYSGGTVDPVIKKFLGLCLVSGLLTFPTLAQAVVEGAGTTSVSSGITASPKTTVMTPALPSNTPSGSVHLPSYPVPPHKRKIATIWKQKQERMPEDCWCVLHREGRKSGSMASRLERRRCF